MLFFPQGVLSGIWDLTVSFPVNSLAYFFPIILLSLLFHKSSIFDLNYCLKSMKALIWLVVLG